MDADFALNVAVLLAHVGLALYAFIVIPRVYGRTAIILWLSLGFTLRSAQYFARSFLGSEIGDRAATIIAVVATVCLVLAVRGIADALTALKSTSDELAVDRDYISQIIETANVLVVQLDEDGTVLRANTATEEVTGYTRTELEGSDWFETIEPRSRFPERWAAALREFDEARSASEWGARSSYENPIVTKSGAERLISWRSSIVARPGGRTERIAFGMDITESSRLSRLMAETLRTSLDGFWLVDAGSRTLTDVNAAYVQLSGYDREALLGMSVSELEADGELEVLLDSLSERAGAGGSRLQTRHRRVDGSQFDVEMSVTYLPEQDAFAIFVRDISERLASESAITSRTEALEVSNAELERFAYVASHDLQEPLRMVTSYLDLLSRRYKGQLDKEADEFIWFAVDGASRMKNLINGLLEYSRVERLGGELVPTDLNDTLEAAKMALSVLIGESGAVIESDRLPQVVCDPMQLSRVFQNVIANAVKFKSDATPRVTIECSRDGAMWHFVVADNGIGFEQQFAERVFELFQRLHAHSTYPGTGLGLAVTRKIVERHGGTCWMESEPGKGTRFHFTLKVEQEGVDAA